MSVVYVWRLLSHGLADRVVTDHPLLVDFPLTEQLLHLLDREPFPQRGQHFPQLGGGHATRAVSIENPKNIFSYSLQIHTKPTGMPQEFRPRFQHNPFVSASC